MRKIELIELTLNEIRRSITTVSDVHRDAMSCNKQENNELFEELINDSESILDYTRIKLREILEKIAEFQNARDMACPVDTALSETAYDLIYERKNEDDF